MLRILTVSLFFLGLTPFFLDYGDPVSAQGGKPVPPDVQKKLDALKKEIAARKLTFTVGHSKASERTMQQLCGLTKVPANVKEVAAQQNAKAAPKLVADVKHKEEFLKVNKLVLPGSLVKPRVEAASYATNKAFDWRTHGKVTPVRDQDHCGSCWAFAAIGAFESSWAIRNNQLVNLSEQQILDCGGPGSCSGGWWMEAFQLMINKGTCSEVNYPYTSGKAGVNQACKNGVLTPFRAVTWGFVAANGAIPTPAAMKQALLRHGPLAVAVRVTPLFQNYHGGAVFNEHDAGPINHGVLLIGWDDTKGKGGCWLIKNSWGTDWGEKGYMWIEYGSNHIGDHAAWVEARSSNYDLDISLKPRYGEVTLKAGFLPDPHNVALHAGGSIRTQLGGVNSYVMNNPDYKLHYTAKKGVPLTIYTQSKGDTTLLVNLPNGKWVANDDSGAGLNAQLRFADAMSGRYDIYVGTFRAETPIPATLSITERK